MKNYLDNYSYLVILFFFGLMWALAFPVVNEISEFSIGYSGKTIAFNPFNNYEFSGLISIPTFLYLSGINIELIAIFFYTVIVIVAFMATGALSYIIFKDKLISILTPFFLTKFIFYNFHGYPLYFPDNYFTFGQFGFYFSLLTITLFWLNKHRASLFMLGILPSIHLPWFLFSVSFVGLALILNISKKTLKVSKLIVPFILGLVITALTFNIHFNYLKDNFDTINSKKLNKNKHIYSYQIENINELKKNDYEFKDDINKKNFGIIENNNLKEYPNHKNAKDRLDTHNTKLRLIDIFDYKNIINFIIFYFPDFFCIFLLYLLFKFSSEKNKLIQIESKAFFVILLILFFVLFFFKLLIIDNDFFLNYPFLNDVINRIIINRYFNVSSILFPILIFGLFLKVYKSKPSLLLVLSFLILIIIPEFTNFKDVNDIFISNYQRFLKEIILFSLFFICFSLAYLIDKFKLSRSLLKNYKLELFIKVIPIIFVVISFLGHLENNSRVGYLYNKFDFLPEIIGSQETPIMIGMFVVSFNNYNYTFHTSQPYRLLNTNTSFIFQHKNNLIEFFVNCKSFDINSSLSAKFDSQKECFESRTKEGWLLLSNHFKTKYLLLNNSIKINNLKALSKNDFFTLYKIY